MKDTLNPWGKPSYQKKVCQCQLMPIKYIVAYNCSNECIAGNTRNNWYKWVHIKNDIKVQYLYNREGGLAILCQVAAGVVPTKLNSKSSPSPWGSIKNQAKIMRIFYIQVFCSVQFENIITRTLYKMNKGYYRKKLQVIKYVPRYLFDFQAIVAFVKINILITLRDHIKQLEQLRSWFGSFW